MRRHHHSISFAVLAWLSLAMPAFAQPTSLPDLQGFDVRNAHFARSFAELLTISNELELAASHYEVDDEAGTEVDVLALPFSEVFSPWGEKAVVGIHTEGVVGYANASEFLDDIFRGNQPGYETAVDCDWSTISGLAGIGPQFTVAKGLTLTPLVDIGVGHIANDTDYSGPGEEIAAELADGILFNWDAWTFTRGLAFRAEWTTPLTERHTLSLLARYDARWTETFETDDFVQEFDARSQLLTARAEVTGPTSLLVLGRPLEWRATLGYRRYIEGDFFEAGDFVTIGGAFEAPLASGGRASIAATFIIDDDVKGVTLGVGYSF